MKIELPKTKNIKTYFKKLFATKGSDPLKMEITPFRDWVFVVAVFFVGLAGVFAFNVYMFIEINKGNFFAQVERPASGATLNQEGLAKIEKGFRDSAERFEKTAKEGIDVVDPSL